MARIEIEWLDDSYDCETCGYDCASGARVRIDGEVKVELIPHAYCYDGDHYPEDEIYRAIIVALGHDLNDGKETLPPQPDNERPSNEAPRSQPQADDA